VIVRKFTEQSMPSDAPWMLIGQRFKTKWSGERAPDTIENIHYTIEP
jgi:hypothetical protein